MQKTISLLLVVLLALSALPAFATTYSDKDTVMQVQQALNEAGYDCGTADGVAGKRTDAAIRQYQADRGMESTGAIDDDLLAAMGLSQNNAADGSPEGAPQAAQRSAEDIVTFGHYEQDNHASNGAEPIEWIVLDRRDERALLLSRYALDAVQYNAEFVDVTWETCSLRSWLNDDFLNAAFTGEEQAAILTTDVDNGAAQCCESFDSIGGNNTRDQVFLLSYGEAWSYFASNEDRLCAPTDYAITKGASWTRKFLSEGNGTCDWWLRSPGEMQSFAFRVASDGSSDMGYGYDFSMGVDIKNLCVRPALWVDTTSEVFAAEQDTAAAAEPAADQTGDASLEDRLIRGRWMIDKYNSILFFSDGTGLLYNLYDGTWHMAAEEGAVVVEFSTVSTDYTWTFLPDSESEPHTLTDAEHGVVLTLDPYDPDEYAELVGIWVSADDACKMTLFEGGKAVIEDASRNQCAYSWCIKNDGPANSGLYLNRYNKVIKGRRELDTLTLHANGQDYAFVKAQTAEAPLSGQSNDPTAAFLTEPANTEALAGHWRGTLTSEGIAGTGAFTLDVLPSGMGEIAIADSGSPLIFVCAFDENGGMQVAVPENSTGLDGVTAKYTVTGDRMSIELTLSYTGGGTRKSTLDCERQ